MPIFVPALVLALAAADAPPAPAQSQAPAPPGRFGRPFISPMGEPFRPTARGDDPLADWFHQADANHDGYLTADEMAKDAARFFAILDLDHDGEIDPEEIDHYEQVIAPEVQGEPADLSKPNVLANGEGGDTTSDADEDGEATRIESGGGLDMGPQGAGPYSLLNIPEPVAGADTDLSRSVSLEEFRQAAIRRFGLLDTAHTGRLTLAELEGARPSPPRRESSGFGSASNGRHRHGGRHGQSGD